MLSSVLFPDTDNLKPWRCLRNVVLFHTAPCGVAIMLGVVTIYQVGPDTPVINFNTASLISLGSLVRITCLCVRVLLWYTSLSLSFSLSRPLPLSLTHIHSLSLSHKHTTHTLSLTHTHTHTHTRARARARAIYWFCLRYFSEHTAWTDFV